jgi:hypothetical protein
MSQPALSQPSAFSQTSAFRPLNTQRNGEQLHDLKNSNSITSKDNKSCIPPCQPVVISKKEQKHRNSGGSTPHGSVIPTTWSVGQGQSINQSAIGVIPATPRTPPASQRGPNPITQSDFTTQLSSSSVVSSSLVGIHAPPTIVTCPIGPTGQSLVHPTTPTGPPATALNAPSQGGHVITNTLTSTPTGGTDVTDGPNRRTRRPEDKQLEADLRRCLGQRVLARRGDTFRSAQVMELKEDGAVGVMMSGDAHLTFYNEIDGDMCMLLGDEYDPTYYYSEKLRAAVNISRDVYKECTIIERHDDDKYTVRLDHCPSDSDTQEDRLVTGEQLRAMVPPWKTVKDNTHILIGLRTTSRGVEIGYEDQHINGRRSISKGSK